MNEADQQLIEKYLSGDLTSSEQIKIDHRIAGDSVFSEALKVRKDMNHFLLFQKHKKEIQPTLDAFGEQFFDKAVTSVSKKTNAKWSPLKIGWSIAATILLLIIAYFGLSSTKKVESSIIALYIGKAKKQSTTRSISNLDNSTTLVAELNHIDSLYLMEQYDKALIKLIDLSQQYPTIKSSSFFFELGQIYLLNNQPIKAIEAFDQVVVGYTNDKVWFSTLAKIKAGQIAAAKKELQTILDAETPYKSDAIILLEELNQ